MGRDLAPLRETATEMSAPGLLLGLLNEVEQTPRGETARERRVANFTFGARVKAHCLTDPEVYAGQAPFRGLPFEGLELEIK